MRKACLLAIVFAIAAMSAAQSPKQTILSAYRRIDTLFAKGDGNGLDKFMRAHVTKDFSSIYNGQKSNIDQNMGPLKPMLAHATNIKRPATQIKSITISGDHATATLSGSFSAEIQGRDGKNHQIAAGSDAIGSLGKDEGRLAYREDGNR